MDFWNGFECNADWNMQSITDGVFKTSSCHLKINPSQESSRRSLFLSWFCVQTVTENICFWLNEQACVQAAPKAN